MKLLFSLFLLFQMAAHADTLLFSQAYDLAIMNAHDVKSSEYKYRSNKEQINQSKAKLYPQINLSGYYRKSENKSGYTNEVFRQGLFSGTASLDQLIYDHSVYANIDIQKLRAEYFKLDSSLKKQDLATKVFGLYLNVMKSENKIKSIETLMKYQKSSMDMLEKKLKKQLASAMDLLEVRVQYNSSKIALQKEKQLLDVYKKSLGQYIGKVSYELPVVDIAKDNSAILAQMQEYVTKRKVSLELQESKINIEVAKKKLEDAYSGYIPTVGFKAAYSRYKTDRPSVDIPYIYSEYAMVTVNFPLYSGGLTSSMVASSKLDLESAKEDYKNAEQQKDQDYETNFVLFMAAKESVEMYQESYKSAAEYVKSVEAGYKYGLKSIVDVNEARKDLYDVKYQYIDNLYQLVDAYIKLLLINNNFEGVKILDEIVQKR